MKKGHTKSAAEFNADFDKQRSDNLRARHKEQHPRPTQNANIPERLPARPVGKAFGSGCFAFTTGMAN